MSSDFNCSGVAPDAGAYFASMGTADLVVTVAALVVTLVTVGIYVEEVLIMQQHFREWRIRHRAIWILGIYPVVSMTSLCAVCVPRASSINSLVASIYFSVCMWLFVRLLMDYYEGCKETMARHLSHTVIRFNTPPACCCCSCLPTAKVSHSNIRVLEMLVLQYVIVRPISLYVNTVLYLDSNLADTANGQTRNQASSISAVGSVSSMLALYAYFVLFFLVREPLRHRAVAAKFYCLQIVLLLMNVQRLIFDILVSTEVIGCSALLAPVHNANRMHNLGLILEMLLVSVVARVYYKKDMENSKAKSEFEDIIARGRQHSGSVTSVESSRDWAGNSGGSLGRGPAVDYGAISSTSTTNSVRSTATGEHITQQPQWAASESSPYPDMTLVQPPSWKEPGIALYNPIDNSAPPSTGQDHLNKLNVKGTTDDQSNV